MKIFAFLVLFPIVLGVKKICPGGTARCPDTSTCCELSDKTFGCCPLENAVCCDDHIHCCPENTKCSAGMCVQSTNTSTSRLHPIKNNDIVCPGGEATCPDQTTCCKSPPGQESPYSCCPMPNAVCCNDGFHCCPKGTTCDLEAQKCLGDGFVSEMYRKKPLRPQHPNKLALIRPSSKRLTNVVCPSSKFQCPDSYTCCKTQTDDWGCCPFPDAMCCADKIHCCPKTMHCDATSQYCSQGTANMTSLPKVPAKRISEEVDIVCPDQTQCDSKSTCCKVLKGKYGCCNYVNATCCSDHLHCCPSGSQCDVKLQRCIFPGRWMPFELNEIFH